MGGYKQNSSGAGRNTPHGTQPAADQILGPSGQHQRSPDPDNLTEHSVAFPSLGPSQPRWDKGSAGELGKEPKGACGQAGEPRSAVDNQGS